MLQNNISDNEIKKSKRSLLIPTPHSEHGLLIFGIKTVFFAAQSSAQASVLCKSQMYAIKLFMEDLIVNPKHANVKARYKSSSQNLQKKSVILDILEPRWFFVFACFKRYS